MMTKPASGNCDDKWRCKQSLTHKSHTQSLSHRASHTRLRHFLQWHSLDCQSSPCLLLWHVHSRGQSQSPDAGESGSGADCYAGLDAASVLLGSAIALLVITIVHLIGSRHSAFQWNGVMDSEYTPLPKVDEHKQPYELNPRYAKRLEMKAAIDDSSNPVIGKDTSDDGSSVIADPSGATLPPSPTLCPVCGTHIDVRAGPHCVLVQSAP